VSDPIRFVEGAALVGAGVIVSGFSFGFASPLGAVLISEGINLAVGGLLPGRSPDSSMTGGNVASADASLPIVYGETLVRANLADFRQDPGSDGKKYHGVPISLCVASEDGSGIEGVPTVYFGKDVAIAGPTVGADQHANGVQSDWSGHLEYGLQLGGDSVVVPTPMNARWPSAWPATSKPTGIATLSLYIDYDQEVYTTGFPTVQILVQGNHVYDPRTQAWGYSTNPWLAVLDYLTSERYGYGAPYPERDGGSARSRIDEQSFIDMADYADELVQDGAGGTQKRFIVNGWIDSGNSYRTNLEALLSACRGALVFESGKIRAYTPRPETVSGVSFDESDFVGGVTYRRAGKIPQHITARYPDASMRHQTVAVDWPTADPNPYLDNDGGLVRETEIHLPMTPDAVRAQQIGMTILKESRFDKTVVGTVTEKALQERVGSVVPVSLETMGWSGKEMRIANLRYRSDFLVDVVLVEYAAAAYDLDPQSAPGSIPADDLPSSRAIAAPTALTLISDASTQMTAASGSKSPGIRASWAASAGPFLSHTIVYARKSGAATWSYTSGPVYAGEDQEQDILPAGGAEGDLWEVGVQAVSTFGRRSVLTTGTVTLTTDYVASDLIGWVVDLDATESDFDADGIIEGRLSATIVVTGTYDLQFSTRQGRGTIWSVQPKLVGITSASGAQTQDVELTEKENSFIRVEIFKSGTSSLVGPPIIVTFDPDAIASVLQLGAHIADDGTPGADVQGDSDTAKIYLTYTTDGTDPAVPTPANADATIAGREGTVTFAGTVPKGSLLTVRARGENASGDIAPQATTLTDTQLRPGAATAASLRADVSFTVDSDGDLIDILTISGTVGADGVGPAEVRYKDGSAAWSAWQASPISSQAFAGFFRDSKVIQMQARDGSAPDPDATRSEIATWVVQPFMQGIDPGDGRIKPAEPASGRWWDVDYIHGGAHWGPHVIGRGPQVQQGFGGTEPRTPKAYVDVMDDSGMTKLIEAATRKIQTGLLAQDGNAVEDRISHTRGDGTLDPSTSQYDGSASLGLGAGFETGQATNGQSPGFSVTRGSVPKVRFYPAGGIMHKSGTTLSGDYGPVFRALNVSSSTFDADLRLVETAGSTTSVSIASWSPGSTYDLETNKSQSAEAYNDQYSLSHHLFIEGGTFGGDCFGHTSTIGYYYRRPAGSWVQESSQQYSSDCDDFDFDVSHTMVVDGMGTGADFAVNLDSGTGTVSDPSSGNAVEWTTATAPGSTPATPSGSQPVPWIASKT